MNVNKTSMKFVIVSLSIWPNVSSIPSSCPCVATAGREMFHHLSNTVSTFVLSMLTQRQYFSFPFSSSNWLAVWYFWGLTGLSCRAYSCRKHHLRNPRLLSTHLNCSHGSKALWFWQKVWAQPTLKCPLQNSTRCYLGLQRKWLFF